MFIKSFLKRIYGVEMDYQPFAIVEDDGFIKSVGFLQPKYMLPSRRHFADEMLPQTYERLEAQLMDDLLPLNGPVKFL